MLVAFWGPVHGQVNTTSNMIAIASMLALDYRIRILLAHTHFEYSTLEKAYSKLRQVENDPGSAGGMDGIYKLVECDMLTPERVRDNAESLIRNRLDMVAGLKSGDTNKFRSILPEFIKQAQRPQSYELLFMDVSSGVRNELSNLVMEHADLIIVNLNQNKAVLDSFFNHGSDWPEILNRKPALYCIGSYHRGSRMSLTRIAKEYNISSKKIGYVPHNIKYLDAQNEQHIIEFLMKVRSIKKKFLDFNEDAFFTEAVREMGKLIFSSLEVFPPSEEEMYD